MDQKNIFIPLFVLLICSKVIANTIIPIHTGKFYTNRNSNVIDTIFLPVDQKYIIKLSAYRYVDSVKTIDNQKYRLSVNNIDLDPKYSNLQNHPEDWPLYKYLVISYKTIIPMFVTIYNQADSITNIWLNKPIDVLYFMTQTISDNCFESYQAYQNTSCGVYLLKYIPLFKYYLQQKIEKETTIISEQSGDLLIDDIYIVLLPCTDRIRIKEGDSYFFEGQY